jgi:hypothetical protein
MNLYSQQGRCLHLDLPAWREILPIARRWGWQPAGTVRPPLVLDGDLPLQTAAWPADTYEPPKGQTVLRRDALSLANTPDSSIRAGSAFQTIPIQEAQQLAEFCRLGPFLICAESPSEGRSTPLPARPSGITSKPAIEVVECRYDFGPCR